MRPRLWIVLGIIALPGCDIDFVAVPENEQAYARLRVDHGPSRLEASLEVSLPETDQLPLVFVGETQLQAETQGERWSYRTEPVVDTLEPRVVLEIRTDEVVVAPLPFITRNGTATRRQNGDLEIPAVYGGDASDRNITWRVVLVDSDGQTLVSLDARSTPLPSPIVVSNALVPAAAVAVQITAIRNEQLSQTSYPFYTATESAVWVPIEQRP